MIFGRLRRFKEWLRADFLSPKDLVLRALSISILFLVVHVTGLRDHTAFLCGTLADPTMSWQWAAFLGCTYLLLYFAFVLLVPILLLAAAASAALHHRLERCCR
jgi:hypothetical protein